ncbi:MAG: hypothetical protein ACRYGG_13155 [Janthinobacterium lividum]
MQVVPLSATPSQTVGCLLGGQSCNVSIYQKRYGLFADVYLNGKLVIGGVVCQHLNRLVRSAYLGFRGDLAFYDTQGFDDPSYDGLGNRWVLLYLSPAETGVAT